MYPPTARLSLRFAAADAFSGVSGRVFLPLRGFTAVHFHLGTKHRLAITNITSSPHWQQWQRRLHSSLDRLYWYLNECMAAFCNNSKRCKNERVQLRLLLNTSTHFPSPLSHNPPLPCSYTHRLAGVGSEDHDTIFSNQSWLWSATSSTPASSSSS